MIITCPECASRFRLNLYEANAVKNQGRIFHCGKCEYEWEVKRVMPPKVMSPSQIRQSEVKEQKQLDQSERIVSLTKLMSVKATEEINFIDQIPLKLKIIFLFLVFLTTSLLVINNRSTITYLFPTSAKFYNFIGIHDNRGVEIERITISKDSVFHKDQLVMAGYVVNNSDENKHTPDLRITFLDENHKVIKTIYSDLPIKN